MELTELQFTILNGLADDYEDVEQLYLFANRDVEREQEANVQLPHMLLRHRFFLREIAEELARMLRDGYIEAKYSNDERLAPLQPLNFAELHHYWFRPTAAGTAAWKAYRSR
jgi:hypothetical protein